MTRPHPTRAGRPRRRLSLEALESRELLAVSFQFDYRFDTSSSSAEKVEAIRNYEADGQADDAGELATEEDLARNACS